MTRTPKNIATDPQPKIRDRRATRRRLVQAVGSLLAREGFAGVGVNAVAREAGVDKVLIYRYFGGLPELMGAFGREGDFWPTLEEMAGGDVEKFRHLAPPDRSAKLLVNFLRGLRRRPVTQEILAWEVQERNELTVELEAVREKTAMDLSKTFGPGTPPNAGPEADFGATIALMAAGIMYLVVRASRGTGDFNGVDLQSEDGWQRLENGIHTIVQGWFKQND